MKKKLVLAGFIAGLLIFGGFMALNAPPVLAQQAQGQTRVEDRWNPANISELYYVNVPIEKVYAYRRGYIVLFRKGANDLGRAYIPFEWFRIEERKAQIFNLGPGRTWPNMSVFYKEGAFYGVRLYVAKSPSHMTWGNVPLSANLDDHFEGVESIDLSHSAD